MNAIVNNPLIVRDKSISEIHLKQPVFIHSTCGPSTKNKIRIKKVKETGDSRFIYQNDLDKTCF